MIKEFLKRHGQSSDNIDVKKSIDCFLSEMKAGLAGKSSSLAMIPTYIYEPDLSSKNKTDKRIVIDAGGTNFRSASGYFDADGSAVFEDLQKTIMPASDRELSKSGFYGAIADNIKRLLPETNGIGFCFSYPVEMGEDRDGVVGTATKEIKAPEIAGTKVGACTLEAVKQYDQKDRSIVILNDTVATLLGGMASVKKEYSAFIGYIYGTGTNVCYTEAIENISKIRAEGGRRMLINTECGNFDGFAQGDYDRKVSAETEYPDRYLFEKMTSGKYLAEVINLCISGAKEEGLIKGGSETFRFKLKDVSEFLNGEKGEISGAFTGKDDLSCVKQICEELIDRAAKMGAIANAAMAIVSGKPDGKPVAVVAEGTTFNKLTGYRKKFEKYLSKFLTPYGITFEIVQGEDLNMLGSLMATVA